MDDANAGERRERGKLLIVDDDVHIRRLLKIFLKSDPFEIYEAGSGDEALDLIGTHEFEVALIDMILPTSNGLRICERLREGATRPSPFVLIMTGDASVQARSSAKRAGADYFLTKPFDASEVVKIIRKRPRGTDGTVSTGTPGSL